MPLPTYLMSNFPSVRPSLNLQFDSQPTPEDMTSHLASVGATFSRASIGTYTDANGIIQEATSGQARPNYSTAGVHEGLLIEESRTNLIKVSEDLTDSDWGKEADVSVLENQAIAPNGKASADKLLYSSTNEFHRLLYGLSVTNGTTYSFSAYVKADGYNFIVIRWQGFVSGGQDNVSFDLVDVEVDYVNSNFDSASIEAVGNDWYKITVVGTAYADSNSVFRIRFQPTENTDNNINRFTGDDESGGFVWGAQFEAGSFPTSYIPTIPTFTSRASDGTYFDSSGVLQTASTDEERIDHKYIDGQWVEAGLLLEGASENLWQYSGDLTQWIVARGTTSTSSVTALDDTSFATEVEIDTGRSDVFVRQSITITSGNTYTASAWFKNNDIESFGFLFYDTVFGSGGNIQINFSDLSVAENTVDSYQLEDYGNGWYRLSATMTADATSTDQLLLQIEFNGLAGESAYVWGAQLEEQSQVTSYIATSGSTATRSADVYTTATKQRSADVCEITGTAFTDFYNQEEGTWYSNLIASGNTGTILDADSPSVDRFPQLAINSSTVIQSSFDSFNQYTVDAISAGDELKISVTVTDGAQRNFYNGEFQEETTIANPKDLDTLYIGDRDISLAALNGTIKKLIYFPRALTDNELIKLTQ